MKGIVKINLKIKNTNLAMQLTAAASSCVFTPQVVHCIVEYIREVLSDHLWWYLDVEESVSVDPVGLFVMLTTHTGSGTASVPDVNDPSWHVQWSNGGSTTLFF